MTFLILSYLGGMITIVSPCILPVLPFVFARAGEPFRRSARHDGMETFRFGPVIEFSKPEGGTGLTPRYLLRLRCEWALVRAGRVLTVSGHAVAEAP